MAELFKLFLVDINLVKLRGVKVSYRYSKVKTAEFELDLLEVLAFKEEIEGISFYREALAEMLAVCESYRIYEEHSQLARHFEEL